SQSQSGKQRRVSLALPSSPRVFPAWSFRDDTGVGVHSADAEGEDEVKKGKMRKIAADGDGAQPPAHLSERPEKKPRKKWTMEETQMLVAGCNKWGVGNWKSILNDPDFRFDGRSPVDLKDRFRTYYPDAYRQHYPNAKTHLSTKVRSALPDGSSIFEKTRSKKRRPFTEEEDRALKAGYDKHGTVWATIVKDPIFQAQNRRSTDLRDRFRNAFPDLYQAAGYKPRNTTKKRRDELAQPMRAATDDALASSSTGPVRRKRRRAVMAGRTGTGRTVAGRGRGDYARCSRRRFVTGTYARQGRTRVGGHSTGWGCTKGGGLSTGWAEYAGQTRRAGGRHRDTQAGHVRVQHAENIFRVYYKLGPFAHPAVSSRHRGTP
ncbi:hypothetical protein K466DRAFT_504161, partial [Polyporus arcularius HHB13444]